MEKNVFSLKVWLKVLEEYPRSEDLRCLDVGLRDGFNWIEWLEGMKADVNKAYFV